nr:type IIL restriction-modification enzyme MmeI [Limosilactobacillus reuteri]
MHNGCKLLDGGFYTLTSQERKEAISKDPYADKFIRPYLGAKISFMELLGTVFG